MTLHDQCNPQCDPPIVEQLPLPWPPVQPMTQQAPATAIPAALPSGGVVPAGMVKACIDGCEAPIVAQLPPVWPSAPSAIGGGGGDTVASIPEAPLDGIQYGRQSAAWTPISGGATGSFLPLTGGTMQGFITLHAYPLSDMQAATKGYVDGAILIPMAVAGDKVDKGGDEMVGWLRFAGSLGSQQIRAAQGGLTRWDFKFNDIAFPESGGNAGSDVTFDRHDDAGVLIDRPFEINRATGNVRVLHAPVQPTDVANKQYVDAAITAAGAAMTTNVVGAKLDQLAALVEYLQTRLASLEATMRGTS